MAHWYYWRRKKETGSRTRLPFICAYEPVRLRVVFSNLSLLHFVFTKCTFSAGCLPHRSVLFHACVKFSKMYPLDMLGAILFPANVNLSATYLNIFRIIILFVFYFLFPNLGEYSLVPLKCMSYFREALRYPALLYVLCFPQFLLIVVPFGGLSYVLHLLHGYLFYVRPPKQDDSVTKCLVLALYLATNSLFHRTSNVVDGVVDGVFCFSLGLMWLGCIILSQYLLWKHCEVP